MRQFDLIMPVNAVIAYWRDPRLRGRASWSRSKACRAKRLVDTA